jgi:hypothetical protein
MYGRCISSRKPTCTPVSNLRILRVTQYELVIAREFLVHQAAEQLLMRDDENAFVDH